ncbi:hypothetical protein OUZ56_027630 [Daphnia magna]|uniref:Uncharacterized protein n=1 Tax=Daphnia magna TaxID=35525 RepID=A0ABR0B1G7_9CRUS|nr:hypothetical protein OUZ56_027630 [Daphnia magna]
MLRKKYANELRGIEQLLFFCALLEKKKKERRSETRVCVFRHTRAKWKET